MKTSTVQHPSGRNGGILIIIMAVLIAFSLLIIALLQLGAFNARETARQLRNAQAFWLAEAGRQMCIADLYIPGHNGVLPSTAAGTNVPGVFRVEADGSTARISIGTVTAGGETVTRRIRINLAFLPRGYEEAIYGGNYTNTQWTFQLSGTGVAIPPVSGSGGIDSIYGDVYINGNAFMAGASEINRPANPNRYSLTGDLDATGSILVTNTASVDGSRNENVPVVPPPNLADMDYAHNNNYDIAQIFRDAGINSGYLPSGHPLRNVVVKNPSSRAAENSSTTGDDFYFEPATIGSAGTKTTAVTPLNLGDDKVYYVDGHVWFNNHQTYGFKVDGTATIVSTRDIHVSDNLSYKDRNPDHLDSDLLALVALGQYSGGVRTSGGDVYFGDPEFGTLYTVDAFMFANNNFNYNTRSNNSSGQEEPESGFRVFGNFMAVNQVVVLRDWYTRNGSPRAAVYVYDQTTSQWQWKDAITDTLLTLPQSSTLRHYAMRVEYDDRIRDAATQMPGLPRGNGTIFAGIKSWAELP